METLCCGPKLFWQKKYPEALREVNKGLKKCFKNKTLEYLLLAEKLSLLRRVKDSQVKDIYLKLRREYQKMPKLARYDVASVLINYYALSPEELYLSKPRIYSKDYNLDKATWVFILLAGIYGSRGDEAPKKTPLG